MDNMIVLIDYDIIIIVQENGRVLDRHRRADRGGDYNHTGQHLLVQY